jgi:sugar phosphate isomerase/epimerase
MPKLPIALQLYTVREDAARDFAGTLDKVAEIGYAGVELAGYNGLSVRDLKARLDDLHLFVAGSHIGIERLESDLAQVVDENLTLGNRYIVVPYLSDDRRQGAEGYKKTAELLNGFGESLQSYGLTLAYHNHDFEFRPLEDGSRGEDILLENTDPGLVKAEVDTYWVLKAGADPVAFVRQHAGRVPLLHLKDRDKTDGSFAPIGTGDLPLDALIAAGGEIGTEYLIVEQDSCKQPPLEAVKLSYENLKAKGYA